jgi:EpsI family protein
MALGAAFTVGTDVQQRLPLRRPLAEVVPNQIADLTGTEIVLPEAERRAAGTTSYLMRAFTAPADSGPRVEALSLYVGYYDRQAQGRTIHSPRNCLPGSGWEALASSPERIDLPQGPVVVNRYLLRFRRQQALVLYWYQGRGRVAYNEYSVKLDLLRDAALRRRSEEALVRIMVPVRDGDLAAALALARRAAAEVLPALDRALPT